MPIERIQVTGSCAVKPAVVWKVVRDFCASWHPAIATMQAQYDQRGALIRVFTVKEDNTVYREQLTFFSDSDRLYSYVMLEGISGAASYTASLSVSPGTSCDDSGYDETGNKGSENRTTITMVAEIDADSKRAIEIASGTKVIFESGINALIERFNDASDHLAVSDQLGKQSSGPSTSTNAVIEERTIDRSPALAVSVTPASDGPLCLFLHGIGGARSNWTPQLKAVGNITQCATMDLRGYGDSKLALDQSTADDYCNDILRILESSSADKLVLCGLSYGSWIATSFAMRYPELLSGLVLSGGCTGMSEATEEARNAFRSSREVPLDAGKTPADFAPDVLKVIAGPYATEQVKNELLHSMASIPVATYRDALACFTNPLEAFDFSKLSMPVLMMTGEYDRLAPADEIRGVARRIVGHAPLANVGFEIIDRAGHVCNVEQADQYNKHLKEFLLRVCQ